MFTLSCYCRVSMPDNLAVGMRFVPSGPTFCIRAADNVALGTGFLPYVRPRSVLVLCVPLPRYTAPSATNTQLVNG